MTRISHPTPPLKETKVNAHDGHAHDRHTLDRHTLGRHTLGRHTLGRHTLGRHTLGGSALGKPSRARMSLGLVCLLLAFAPAAMAPATAVATSGGPSPAAVVAYGQRTNSLESAASKAGDIGRKIAMSLIGLGLAIASMVLALRRDFKEAVGVFVVGFVAILLATPAGVNVLHDTVNTLFG